MKCKILHESKGRLRVHLFCGKMSLDNADVLEYYLRAVNGVTDVSVYDRTCDAVIVFTDRKAVLKALAAFAFANWMIHTSVWHHCPVSFARALQCLAGYAFGIYMVHPLVHEVLSKLIPQGAHSVRIISLNPITIFLISLCCCILLARIKPFRKWLLLRK